MPQEPSEHLPMIPEGYKFRSWELTPFHELEPRVRSYLVFLRHQQQRYPEPTFPPFAYADLPTLTATIPSSDAPIPNS